MGLSGKSTSGLPESAPQGRVSQCFSGKWMGIHWGAPETMASRTVCSYSAAPTSGGSCGRDLSLPLRMTGISAAGMMTLEDFSVRLQIRVRAREEMAAPGKGATFLQPLVNFLVTIIIEILIAS